MFYLLSRSRSESYTRENEFRTCQHAFEKGVRKFRFERYQSQFNISINLFSHSNSDIYPIRITKSSAAKHIDLLITSNVETNHYVWIKNFNKLCSKITKHTTKKFFCKHCIQHFTSESKLEKHMEDCMLDLMDAVCRDLEARFDTHPIVRV